MDLKMLVFPGKKKVFGANGVPKNEPEKMKKRRAGPGPMLLPSVAPEGTPPAMLLKKLAFGIQIQGSGYSQQQGSQWRKHQRIYWLAILCTGESDVFLVHFLEPRLLRKPYFFKEKPTF